MDKKDIKILAELDLNFRMPFSKLGKKVGLSKNSVAIRFSKLLDFMSHNIAGLDYMALGYRMVKVFYSLANYNDKIEKEIIEETKKNKNIFWEPRLFGNYDLEICLLVKDIPELITQINKFEKRFIKVINHKDILIIENEFYNKYTFLHEKGKNKIQILKPSLNITKLTKTEKKILLIIRSSPRKTILDISRQSGLTPKTVSDNIKNLEKGSIILGYFLSLNLEKFNYGVYKLLIQIQNVQDMDGFEEYLCLLEGMKHLSKTLGLWNYELDIYAENLSKIHSVIDLIKNKFPKTIKKIDIITHGKRLITNKEGFLR